MYTISVIIPVYNTDEFVEQCMESVWEQTYTNLEIILINDDSNYRCERLLMDLADRDDRIRLFHMDERKGVGHARNFGMDQASGDFFYFLDSDDYIQDDTLELLIDYIGGYEMISGKIVKSHLSLPDSESDDQTDVNEELDESSGMMDEVDPVTLYDEKRFRLIKDKSALNRLFRADFLREHDFRFREDIDRYTDLTVLIPVFLHMDAIPYIKTSIYYKRRRNDPIANPGLMQTGIVDRIYDFSAMYHIVKNNYNDEQVHDYIDNQFLNLYRSPVVRHFKINEYVDTVFEPLVEVSERVSPHVLRRRSQMIRKEIRTLAKGDMRKFKKVNRFHHRRRKVKSAMQSRRKFFLQLYRIIFLRMPIRKRMIVFESFLGKSYSDNPKYIYQYMIDHDMDYEYIWIFRDGKRNIPGNAKQVMRFSLKYYYYMARAKFWVSNSRLPKSLNKRDGNIYLQTWHGTPLKSLVFDMKDVHSANPEYKRDFYDQSRRWDYLISPNAYSTEIFRRAFRYDGEMLEYGYPRNDILYQKNTEADIRSLKQDMGLPQDKKVILYAPTWRDDEFYSRGRYKFTLQLDLDQLREQLNDDYIILLRMHYFIANELDISGYEGFVHDVSDYNDIAELYLVTDVLITDYSSVFFDFANLKRPILFYTYDLEKYRDQLRGFYLDLEEEAPGPLLKTTGEVIEAVNNLDTVMENCREKYEAFHERFCSWDDGNASRHTVQALLGSNKE